MTQEVIVTGRARSRDVDELTRVFIGERRRLVAVASFLLRNPADADDVVQDVYTHLLEGGQRPTDSDRLAAYMQRSVVNLCNSRLRRQVVALSAFGRLVNRQPTHALPADDGYDRFRSHEMVAALHQLPRRMREAVVLRYYADLSLADTAHAMGVSIGTAKSATSRGLEKLAHLLEEN